MKKKTQEIVQGERKPCRERGKTCREKERDRTRQERQKKLFFDVKAFFIPPS